MKDIVYCARCGAQSRITLKAVPSLGVIVKVVAPHECGESTDFSIAQLGTIQDVKEVEDMPFCQFLTKEGKKPLFPGTCVTPSDAREKREEITTTTAPENLLRALMMKGGQFDEGGEMEG